jgi:hypothetical protein
MRRTAASRDVSIRLRKGVKKVSYKLMLNVFSLGILSLALSGIASANPYLQDVLQMEKELTEETRLQKECDAAWVKSSSNACKKLKEVKAQIEARSRRNAATIGALEGINAADSIRNSVRNSGVRMQNSNTASQARQSADYWARAHQQALRNNDRNAAARAQDQFNYYQRQAIEYGR